MHEHIVQNAAAKCVRLQWQKSQRPTTALLSRCCIIIPERSWPTRPGIKQVAMACARIWLSARLICEPSGLRLRGKRRRGITVTGNGYAYGGCLSPSALRNFSSKIDASADDRSAGQSILGSLKSLGDIPLSDVRNFCFIAHVDHGKSSLASRVLELTGNLGSGGQGGDGTSCDGDPAASAATAEQGSVSADASEKEQIGILDTLAVEKERGITVKATAASMLYRHPSAVGPTGCLLLNMVDTPGHADFGSEVSRSLSAVDGAVLLFDAAQGVQAQTLSVHEKATALGVKIIPALTKTDLPSARPLDVALAVSDLFGFDPDGVLLTSARSRLGISDVLEAVCSTVSAPAALSDDDGTTLRAKVVDSWFEPLRGVICLVKVLSGKIIEGDRISVAEPSRGEGEGDAPRVGREHYSVQDIGIVLPRRVRTGSLDRGQMGYVIVGLRDPRQARPGSILVLQKDMPAVAEMILPFPPEAAASTQSALYASVHPIEGDGFDEISASVDRLALNDTGLEVHRMAGSSNSEGGPFLGPGLRVGFQGLLHVEVFRQRLLDEFGLEAIVTPPKVPYTIKYLASQKHKRAEDAPKEVVVEDLSQWPSHGQRFKVFEPIVDVRIMAPMDYAGNIMDLIKRRRGIKIQPKPIDEHTWLFTASIPWGEVVTDFYDELKTTSAGYASFDSQESEIPHLEADLAKIDILLNGDVVGPLSFVSHKDNVQREARKVCKKLQDALPRQHFVTVIQAKSQGRIVSSERIRAYRKDVLSIGGGKSVGGGDISRKKKLLEKQKKGKKRQQSSGKVQLSQEAFNSVISRS